MTKHYHRFITPISVTLMMGLMPSLHAAQEKPIKRNTDASFSVLLGGDPSNSAPGLHLKPKGHSHYRVNPHPRVYGMTQGNVGSCAADADIAALESAFSFRRLDVRLSTFYRHAYNWRVRLGELRGKQNEPKSRKLLSNLGLDLKEEDLKLLEAAGPIVPNYMFPEDGEGLNVDLTGMRPNPSQIATIPSIWLNAKKLGFSEEIYSLTFGKTKYSNSADLGTLKALVEKGSAITLSLNSDAFYCLKLNGRTGDLEKAYNRAEVEKCIKRLLSEIENNHAVAVLGFDDSYYKDLGGTGALFIRNSHNDRTAISDSDEAQQERSDRKNPGIGKFKQQTLLNENHPGYYALPYEFIQDSFPNPLFKKIDLDFDAFASLYQKFRMLYQVQYVPFTCEHPSNAEVNPSLARSDLQYLMKLKNSPEKLKEFESIWISILQQEASYRTPTGKTAPRFEFAKLSMGPIGNSPLEVDRALEFRQGKFSRYYCRKLQINPNRPLKVWPNETFYSELIDAQDRLSESPYSSSAWEEFLSRLIQLGVPNDFR